MPSEEFSPSSSSSVPPSILRQMEALVRLMQRPGTEAEGIAATGRLQELALKYGLSVDSFSADSSQRARANSKWKGVQEDVERKHGARSFSSRIPWKIKLFDQVCKAYFCEPSYYKYGTSYVFTVIGKPRNVAIAGLMYDYLENIIDQLTISAILERRAAIKSKYGTGPGQGSTEGREWGDSFRLGMVDKVYSRMKDEMDSAGSKGYAANTATGEQEVTALVLKSAIDAEREDLRNFHVYERQAYEERNRILRERYEKEAQNAVLNQSKVTVDIPKVQTDSRTEAQRKADERRQRNQERAWYRKSAKRAEREGRERKAFTPKNSDGYNKGFETGSKVVLKPIE